MIYDQNNKSTQKLGKEVKLTALELKVLDMMMTNKNEKFIADQLNVPQETLKAYIKNIYLKTGTNSFANLIDWALDEGLVSPNF